MLLILNKGLDVQYNCKLCEKHVFSKSVVSYCIFAPNCPTSKIKHD
jgi:hypothetical protein